MNAAGSTPDTQKLHVLELEAMEGLARHARIEAEARGAGDGSLLARKAACLEWLAATAAYSAAMQGPIGTMLPSQRTEAAERAVAAQFGALLQERLDT